MRDYTLNKAPKDPKLCTIIRKTITTQKKELGLSREDVAHELGMGLGYLDNQLTPSMTTNDMSITDFMHLLELTGDYAALEYIVSKFDYMIVKKSDFIHTCSSINILIDNANIESGDVFRASKMALLDGEITEEERDQVIQEIEEEELALANLKEAFKNASIKE